MCSVYLTTARKHMCEYHVDDKMAGMHACVICIKQESNKCVLLE
jgi:hypothetical protein